jgi:hypothetical protein
MAPRRRLARRLLRALASVLRPLMRDQLPLTRRYGGR